MDMLLGPDHDCLFVNGTCPVTTDRVEAIQQRLKVKLLTFLGEWFLNTSYGVPYFQQIFGKQRDKATVDNILQNSILEEDGVIRIDSFSSSLSTDRGYSLSFRVIVDDGSTTEDILISINI